MAADAADAVADVAAAEDNQKDGLRLAIPSFLYNWLFLVYIIYLVSISIISLLLATNFVIASGSRGACCKSAKS